MKWLTVFILVFVSTVAYADDGILSVPGHKTISVNLKWKEECGSCHVAYPPQLLTAGDWQRLMEELDRHFDENAVLDPKDNKKILDFLQSNAGSGKKNSAPSLRISDTPWFTRKHRAILFIPGVIRSFKNKGPAVKSLSNCTACHINAERGDWSKRGGIRAPGWQRRDDAIDTGRD